MSESADIELSKSEKAKTSAKTSKQVGALGWAVTWNVVSVSPDVRIMRSKAYGFPRRLLAFSVRSRFATRIFKTPMMFILAISGHLISQIFCVFLCVSLSVS